MALLDIFSAITKNAQPAQSSAGKIVGIDIGASSIKVVELENRNDVITLTSYGELELGPYDEEKPIGSAVILSPQLERQALVDILRESAIKAKKAVFAMPLTSSFVTIMSLQATPEEDIAPRVRVEARKYIPIPIAEVTLDWAELDSITSAPAPTREVLLAAIQNDALSRFNGLMDTVELRNTPIEIECFSAIRSLYFSDEVDVAIIDIGAHSTKLYIARNGLLQRMYRVRVGGADITDKLAKELSVTFEEAEVIKRSVTQTDQTFAGIQKQYNVTYDRAVKEFKQVLDEYEKKLGVQLSTVYLIGGGALFINFDKYVESILNKKVTLPVPFNKVAYPAFMEDTLCDIGPAFTIALGAALRHFE